MPFRSYIICALLQILQEPVKPNNPGSFVALKLWRKIKFSLTCCQHLSTRWPSNLPLAVIDFPVMIKICLISAIHHFLFDTRVASLTLHSNTELAEVVLEVHRVSLTLCVVLWYEQKYHKSVLKFLSVLQDVYAALDNVAVLQECGICGFLFTSSKVWTQSRSAISSEL